MIHYSCDRCRCPIGTDQAVRYVVRMEIEATLNVPQGMTSDEDQDCLLEMDQLLEHLEDEVPDEEPQALYQKKRFDLCPECYRKFVKNPMGCEKLAPFGFSPN